MASKHTRNKDRGRVVIPGEQFFEYIIANWYWIIRLVFAVITCSVLWVLPFVIVFSPLYYDDITISILSL